MAYNEDPQVLLNVERLQFPNLTTVPTLNLSGAIYVSGGALSYKGSTGTITQLAVA